MKINYKWIETLPKIKTCLELLNEVDKCNKHDGRSVKLHSIHVMRHMIVDDIRDSNLLILALLHDLLEESPNMNNIIIANFGYIIYNNVCSLTDVNDNIVDNVTNIISGGLSSIIVKCYDIYDNIMYVGTWDEDFILPYLMKKMYTLEQFDMYMTGIRKKIEEKNIFHEELQMYAHAVKSLKKASDEVYRLYERYKNNKNYG